VSMRCLYLVQTLWMYPGMERQHKRLAWIEL
jgi:hypothetical protein